ncbi:hypothetical protein NL676_008698 [Syzygium grande]|nr:hypothetical protein NL676_008698 [Syzygium grande]
MAHATTSPHSPSPFLAFLHRAEPACPPRAHRCSGRDWKLAEHGPPYPATSRLQRHGATTSRHHSSPRFLLAYPYFGSRLTSAALRCWPLPPGPAITHQITLPTAAAATTVCSNAHSLWLNRLP